MELCLEQKICLLVHAFNCVNYNVFFLKIVLDFLEYVHKQKDEGLQSIIKKKLESGLTGPQGTVL